MLNGRGDAGWFGWPVDADLEALKKEFISADGPDAQLAAAKKVQAHAIDQVIYIPLGEYNFPQARRTVLNDMLPTPVPVFWNLTKTGE